MVRAVKPVAVVALVRALNGTVRNTKGEHPEFKPWVRFVDLPSGWHDSVRETEKAHPGGRCTFGGTVDMVLNECAFQGRDVRLRFEEGVWLFSAGAEVGQGQTASQAIWAWVRNGGRLPPMAEQRVR